MGAIRILLVVPVEGASVFECRVVGGGFDLVVEDDVGEADDRVADEF